MNSCIDHYWNNRLSNHSNKLFNSCINSFFFFLGKTEEQWVEFHSQGGCCLILFRACLGRSDFLCSCLIGNNENISSYSKVLYPKQV